MKNTSANTAVETIDGVSATKNRPGANPTQIICCRTAQ